MRALLDAGENNASNQKELLKMIKTYLILIWTERNRIN